MQFLPACFIMSTYFSVAIVPPDSDNLFLQQLQVGSEPQAYYPSWLHQTSQSSSHSGSENLWDRELDLRPEKEWWVLNLQSHIDDAGLVALSNHVHIDELPKAWSAGGGGGGTEKIQKAE